MSSRGLYTHHGLYIGDGQVIHYAGFSTSWQRGKVEQVDLATFEAGKGSTVRPYKRRTFAPAKSVARARARMGGDHYCLFANNCEHFVRSCIMGDHDSTQVIVGAHAANAFAGALGGIGTVVTVAEVGTVAGLAASGIMSGPGHGGRGRGRRRDGRAGRGSGNPRCRLGPDPQQHPA